MKVYIVTRDIHYEGSEIVGVFDTEIEAEDYAKSELAKESYTGLDYVVTQWVVNGCEVGNPRYWNKRDLANEAY